MKKGFVTDDGYAAVPLGKKDLIVIYNGHQLEKVSTVREAQKFIKTHRMQPQTGTVFVQ